MAETICLVCNAVIRTGSGKNIFQKGVLGLRALKERLQVVLQVNLDRRSSHSSRLCLACFKQLAVIDKYQCNIEQFSDTFQDAAESRELDSSDNDDDANEASKCFTCNIKMCQTHGTENPDGKNLKTRLERILSVNLEKESAGLSGCIELCVRCVETLSQLEEELQAVTDFSSRYRITRGMYTDDDIDDDLVGMMDTEEADGSDENSDLSLDLIPRLIRNEQSMYNAEIVVNYEEIAEAEKNVIRKGRKGFQCALCDHNRKSLRAMRYHVLLHTGLKPYACRKCGNGFTDRSGCIKHVNKCGKRKPAKPHTASPQSVASNCSASAGSATDFTIPPQFMDLTEEGSDEEPTEKMKTGGEYSKVATISGGDEFECSLCGESFSTVSATNTHMQMHKANAQNIEWSSGGFLGDQGTAAKAPSSIPSSQQVLSESFVDLADVDGVRNPTGPLPSSTGTHVEYQSENLVRRLENPTRFECTVCNSLFRYRRDCVEHARNHTGERPFVCTMCHKSYKRLRHYKRHLSQHKSNVATALHTNEKPVSKSPHIHSESESLVIRDEGTREYRCKACDYPPSLSRRRVREHVRVHTNERPFVCRFCNKAFKSSGNYYRHRALHTNAVISLKPEKQQIAQSTPLDSSKPIILDSSSENETPKASVPTEIRPSNYNQSNPDIATSLMAAPLEMRMSAFKAKDNVIQGSDTTTSAYTHDNVNQRAEIYAQSLDSPAVSQTVHSLIFVDVLNQLYKCTKCAYKHKYKYEIEQHVLSAHLGEKRFRCGYCMQQFSEIDSLCKHEEAHNLEVDQMLIPFNCVQQMFTCPVCHYGHKKEDEIRRHLLVHTGVKQHKCSHCPMLFHDHSDRHNHEQKYHGKQKSAQHQTADSVTSLKQLNSFQCDVCQVSFRYANTLKRHQELHKSNLLTNQAMENPSVSNNRPPPAGNVPSSTFEGGDKNLHHLKTAFPSTIEQMATGEYRCILCCQIQSFDLGTILTHQSDSHSEDELTTYKDMVNSGKISLIEQDGLFFCCKICPFKSFCVSETQPHMEQFHFVSLQQSIVVEDDVVNNSLIMKRAPKSMLYQCMFCPVRHRALKMLAKHVKFKHPKEFNDAKNISVETNARCSLTEALVDNASKKSNNLPYVCLMCSHMFEEPGDLQVHFGEHVHGYVYPFTPSLRLQALNLGATSFFDCTLCGATFVNHHNFNRHRTNHGSISIPLNSMLEKANPISGAFSCPLCSVTVLGYQRLVEHLEHHKLTGPFTPGQDTHRPPSQPLSTLSPNQSLPLIPFQDSFDQIQNDPLTDLMSSSVVTESSSLANKEKCLSALKSFCNQVSGSHVSSPPDRAETIPMKPVYRSRIDDLVTSMLRKEPESDSGKRQRDPDPQDHPNKRQCSASSSNEIKTVKTEQTEHLLVSATMVRSRNNNPCTADQPRNQINDAHFDHPTLRAALKKTTSDIDLQSAETSATEDLYGFYFGLHASENVSTNQTAYGIHEDRLPNSSHKTQMREFGQTELSFEHNNILGTRSFIQKDEDQSGIKVEQLDRVDENVTSNVSTLLLARADAAVSMAQQENPCMANRGKSSLVELQLPYTAQSSNVELITEQLDPAGINNRKVETGLVCETHSSKSLSQPAKVAAAEDMIMWIKNEKKGGILDSVLEKESWPSEQLNIGSVFEQVSASIAVKYPGSSDNSAGVVASEETQCGRISDLTNPKSEDAGGLTAKVVDMSKVGVVDCRPSDEVSVPSLHAKQDNLVVDAVDVKSVRYSSGRSNEAGSGSTSPGNDCTKPANSATGLDGDADKDKSLPLTLTGDTIDMGGNQNIPHVNLSTVQPIRAESSNDSCSAVSFPASDSTNELDEIALEITRDGTAEIHSHSGDSQSNNSSNWAVLADTTAAEPTTTSAECVVDQLPLPTVTSATSTCTSSIEDASSSYVAIDDQKKGVTAPPSISIVCSLCHRSFHKKLSYLQHLKTHTIKCPSCSFVFNDISMLHTHFEEVH